MNTKFILGFVIASVLIVSMVSAWDWPWSESGDVSLSPGGSGRGSGGSGTAGTGSGGSGSSGSQVRANSCDADQKCEAESIVGTGDSLLISNSNSGIAISGERITLLPRQGSSVTAAANLIITSAGDLIIQPSNEVTSITGLVKTGSLSVGTNSVNLGRTFSNIPGGEKPVFDIGFTQDGSNPQYTTSIVSRADSNIYATLAGQGTAYACLDENGKLYRSNVKCR